jgi:hypothetical protein
MSFAALGRFVSSTSKVARAAGTVEVKAGRNLPKITQNIGTKGPNKALPSHAHKAAMHDGRAKGMFGKGAKIAGGVVVAGSALAMAGSVAVCSADDSKTVADCTQDVAHEAGKTAGGLFGGLMGGAVEGATGPIIPYLIAGGGVVLLIVFSRS